MFILYNKRQRPPTSTPVSQILEFPFSPFSKVTVNVSDLVRMNTNTHMKILVCVQLEQELDMVLEQELDMVLEQEPDMVL